MSSPFSSAFARPIQRALSRALRRLVGGAAAAPRTFDFYVDSRRPDNSGDGLTPATAKRDLSAVMALVTEPGKSVGLVRGSEWAEQVSPVHSMAIGVTSGVGSAPILDCRDVVTGWTRHDPGALPNVWSVAWVRNGPIIGSDDMGLWVDGVRPRLANTLGDLNSNGGWFVFDNEARTINSTIYVHSTTDPNTNGKVYKAGRRNHGFNWHPQTSASTAIVDLEGPIEVRGSVSHYNAVAAGSGSVKKMVFRDGNIHSIVASSELVEDCVATEARPNSVGIPFTAYRANGDAFSAVHRRCHVLMPGGAARELDRAFHSHSSTGNALIDSYEVTECTVRGRDGMSAGALVQKCNRSYFEDPYQYVVDLNAASVTVEYLQTDDTTDTPYSGAAIGFRKSNGGSSNHIIRNCSIRLRKGIGANADSGGMRTTYENVAFRVGSNGFNGGLVTANKCIVHADAFAMAFLDEGYIGDYNVFFPLSGQDEPWFRNSGGSVTTYNAIGNWRLWYPGQDTNSVFVKPVDQTSGNPNAFWLGVANGTGGPEVGDWRINPNAKVYGDGGDLPDATYVGTFVDGTPITQAGQQSHWNHNTRSLVAGPPTRRPTLPAQGDVSGEAAMAAGAWNFYP